MTRITIPVADETEGELIQEGLEEPSVRNFVRIVAELKRMGPSPEGREFIKTFVQRLHEIEREFFDVQN